VLLLQTLEGGEAILDLLQARRRGVDVLRVRAQEERQVLELRLHLLARLDVGGELRIEGGELADLLPHDGERRQRRLVPFIERGIRLRAEPLQAIGVGQHLARRGELFVLARLRGDLVDLRELEREELGARGFLLLAGGEARALVADALPVAKRRRHAVALRHQPRELVEQIEMRRRIEKDLVLVLPVQIDQRSRGVAQRAAGDERAVGERAAAPLRTSSELARPPTRRPTAPTRIDLPAPVSPVRTLSPGANSSSRRSITARFVTLRKRIMRRLARPRRAARRRTRRSMLSDL